MHPLELGEIKHIRKKLGLSQTQLANQAGVSQSLIAKIESGLLDPTYTNAQKIFRAIDELSQKHELKAKDVMQKKITAAKPDENIKEVIKTMKKQGISQMPVIHDNKSIGLISESIILDALDNKKAHVVKDIMGESPPVIEQNSSIDVVANLLRYYPMVLVTEKGIIQGLITKADLLSTLYK